ncbi:PucR family transcriptional regulator ligand-binding domain-containing protein [Nocardioides sp. S-58]|uniref:PucR family transcriptional regulator ligand-binding domain-containing protein n=1 Tax=Nocardioides renjunii TaxID=3095075 RepID=A0ABU5KAC3_9ACTN|nr:PucR family transcriptional regulator ligand-binding domain-containing protein [Nocardioides sp. S-58]MDZ5661520.1 PucR family transcriptional regulator ligand-binding domain-containing protein [Nocardioides sp. S-58]
MLTVGEVLAMPPLRGARPRVVAGASGLDRPVRWVHTTELADIAPLLRAGDLLLSTGIAMPDGGPELEAYAASLAGTAAAGLVVELGRRWTELPQALVAACEDLGLPLVALHREVRFAAVAQAVGERIVDRQVAELREAQRVHETFTELGIAEAGPSEILDAVQRLAGTAVVLESEEHQVLDYRPGPRDADGFLTDWAARSREVPQEDRTTWEESHGWLVTRVGRRDRRWGRLVVHSADEPSERLVAVAERGAAALALHRLHDRQRDGAVRRTHHELVLRLLTEAPSPDLLRRCELAGLPTSDRQLVGVTLRPRFEDAGPGSAAALVEDVIAATVHATHELRVPALVCEMERDVRVLLSFPPSTRVRTVVDDLAARVRRHQPLVVGVGRPVGRAAAIDRTLREAQQVVRSVPGGAADGVHRLEDVHLRGLLAMIGDDDRLRLFVDRELDPLREHDERTGSRLLDAVRALVTHPTSKSDAAASLHLSRPVFYDRLAKASRVLGADLDDPDVRVSLHVALLADEVEAGPRPGRT